MGNLRAMWCSAVMTHVFMPMWQLVSKLVLFAAGELVSYHSRAVDFSFSYFIIIASVKRPEIQNI